MPGDHVSWHAPLNGESGRITQILMGRDPQLPLSISTPHGEVHKERIKFVLTSEHVDSLE